MRVRGESTAALRPNAPALRKMARDAARRKVAFFTAGCFRLGGWKKNQGPVSRPALERPRMSSRLPVAAGGYLPVLVVSAFGVLGAGVAVELLATVFWFALASARAFLWSAFACFLHALSSAPF